MIKILDKIGEKFPKKLGFYLVAFSFMTYALDAFSHLAANQSFINHLVFSRGMIAKGEIWRIFTYVLVDKEFIKSFSNIILSLLSFYITFSFMETAEHIIGSTKINSYIIANYILLTIYGLIVGDVSISYMYVGIILGVIFYMDKLGMVHPLNLALAIIVLIQSIFYVFNYPFILISLVLSFLYFGNNIRLFRRSTVTEVKQKKNIFADKAQVARHKCTVCGKTDLTHPDMIFRFCSKCEGNYEYCEEHLKNHEHKSKVIQFPGKTEN